MSLPSVTRPEAEPIAIPGAERIRWAAVPIRMSAELAIRLESPIPATTIDRLQWNCGRPTAVASSARTAIFSSRQDPPRATGRVLDMPSAPFRRKRRRHLATAGPGYRAWWPPFPATRRRRGKGQPWRVGRIRRAGRAGDFLKRKTAVHGDTRRPESGEAPADSASVRGRCGMRRLQQREDKSLWLSYRRPKIATRLPG